MNLLEVRNLNLEFKLYEGMAHVLRNVSLDVGAGEHVAIVGESGCGKSVTLRAILGLIDRRKTRVTGDIVFAGHNVVDPDYHKLLGKELAMIFQDPMAALNPTFTINDQMSSIIRRCRRGARREETRRAAVEALRAAAIRDPERVLDAYPFQLSGGLNQRILIAMALMSKPRLLLADEPGTALDVTVQRQTLELMASLVQDTGAAILLITHNLGVVREFSNRVYVMYAGTIVESGSTEEIFKDCRHPYTKALIESVPKLTGAGLPQGIAGSIPDYTTPPAGCRFHPRCSSATGTCRDSIGMTRISDTHEVRCALYSQGVCNAK